MSTITGICCPCCQADEGEIVDGLLQCRDCRTLFDIPQVIDNKTPLSRRVLGEMKSLRLAIHTNAQAAADLLNGKKYVHDFTN